MRKIKTYIINLERSIARREYMEDLLSPYSFLDVEFIKAIYGRDLTAEEKNKHFDMSKCLDMIGRELNAGEIGCTLSHRRFCETLLSSKEPYALVLEDDITIIRDLNKLRSIDLDLVLKTETPTALILSGDYWYWQKRDIVSVYDCVGAYAYIMNKAAAQLILSHKACGVADNWSFYMSYGLKIKAVRPYMVDANLNMDILSSDVAQDEWVIHRDKMKLKYVLSGYIKGGIKRLLKLSGRFEAKVRVINNVIVK